MKTLTGPRLLIVLLAILYGLFWLWYGGYGEPLAQAEVDRILARIEGVASGRGGADPELLSSFRRVGEADDGHEFYMVNLMRHREKALYPEGYEYDDDVEAAERRYAAGVLPALLKRGSLIVFLGSSTGLFLQPEGSEEWDQVGIVRYRSRRDFLEMAAELAEKDLGVHKWASLEASQVFPVTAIVSFIQVRSALAVLLLGLGGGLHLALRRFPWYRREHAQRSRGLS